MEDKARQGFQAAFFCLSLAGELGNRLSLNGHLGNLMKAYIIAAGLALSVMGSASATTVDSGADAQKACRAFVGSSFQGSDEARAAGSCEGMVETAMVFSPNLPADLRGCPPPQGSVLESAKVLLRYLDNNPDRMDQAGITLTFEAFRDAWPCRGDDAEAAAGPGPKAKKRAAKKSKVSVPPLTGTAQ